MIRHLVGKAPNEVTGANAGGPLRLVNSEAGGRPHRSVLSFCGQVKKFLHNVAERIKSMREGRRDTQYQISWDQQGVRVDWLTLENTRASVAFAWNSVGRVETFKRDFFTVDCICLAFAAADGWIEVNEDMKGWRDFLVAVESSLPGFPSLSSWYGKVMLPPFEANHARLWERKSGPQNQSLEATAAGA